MDCCSFGMKIKCTEEDENICKVIYVAQRGRCSDWLWSGGFACHSVSWGRVSVLPRNPCHTAQNSFGR